MSDVVKTGVFGSCMNNVASALGAPVMCTSGECWGKRSFFQELQAKAGHPFREAPGIRYASVTVGLREFVVGPFRTGEVCTLDEELCEAREKLPVWKEHIQQYVDVIIKQVYEAAKQAVNNEQELEHARLLLDFLHTVGHVQDVETLLAVSAQFLVQKFRLCNAVVHALNTDARYFESSAKAYAAVEKRIIGHVRGTRASFTVQNVLTDFLLEGIEGLKELPPCISAFPLADGYVLLYAEKMPDTSAVGEVLQELSGLLKRATQYQEVQKSAVTDALTKLYNRHQMVASMDTLLPRLAAENSPVSVLLFDVDNFKKFNDTEGHPEGDRVLQAIADVVRATIPKEAIGCRYGGEEFVVVLPGAGQEKAKQVAEELRSAVAESCPLTVSIGVMTCMNSSASRETLIREADRALYRAKHLGKNRVVPFIMVDKHLGVIDA